MLSLVPIVDGNLVNKDDIISLIFPLIFTSLHILAALTTTKGFFFKEKYFF